jgi:stearoyl-CoA desaturase (Delta-9 desaturase)
MPQRRLDWVNIVFLSLTPVIGVAGTAAYSLAYGVRWWEPALFFVLFGLVSFSVTAGYHRCFAHKAYRANPLLEAFYLFFGAMALQNSALKWSADHRDHHRYVDRDWDPYSIRRGGLWAHILWLFYKEPEARSFENVPDLKARRLVMWQHRFSHGIGIVVGLGLPTLVGAAFGRPLGGLLWGGFLRIAFIHHTTFLVNSVAHLWGRRPYSEESTARDNALLAFVTNGEGYHNFHHKFPSDFRNGVRWYQWDPTKWLILALRRLGLARNLHETPRVVIETSRLRLTLAHADRRLERLPEGLAESMRARLERARRELERTLALWRRLEGKGREAPKRQRRVHRALVTRARRERRAALRLLAKLPDAA